MKIKALVGFALVWTGQAARGQESPPPRLDLDSAVVFALKHSPVLAGARAEVKEAHAEVGAARARTAPQISANGFTSRGNMQSVLSTGMGVEPQALVLSPAKPFTDVNLTLMVPLYSGGRLSGAVSSASATALAMQADAQEMEAEVTLMVRESYLRVLLADDLLRAQQSKVEAAEAMVRNAQTQFEVGKSIQANVQRATAELADARRELTMTQNDRDKMMLDLLEAMGANLDSAVMLTSVLNLPSMAEDLAGYLKRALSNRGSLVAAMQRFLAAKAGLSAARGARGPQLFGFAMSDSFSPRDEMGRSSGYTVGLNLSLPLFDGGMRSSDSSGAAARVDQAVAAEARARFDVEKQVRAAWLDYRTAQANYANAQAALDAAQSAYDVIVLRVESGKSILLEQLDALAALTRAKANVSQAIFDNELAVARLDRAAGATYRTRAGGN